MLKFIAFTIELQILPTDFFLLDFIVFKIYETLYIYSGKNIFKANYFLADMLIFTTVCGAALQ